MGKVLVVDSSLLDRKRMRSILEAAGHSVVELTSPVQALEELKRLPLGAINIVLTELYFADGSGMDLIRELKSHPQLNHMAVLVVTAHIPRETVIELVKLGASTVVSKPFGGDMLLRRVTETLAAQAALRQGEGESISWHIGDYLRRELKRAERNGNYYSLVLCRILEEMNGQALPHLMGGLVHIMRESDVLVRLGDQEIAILLPETDWLGASVVESRVRAVVLGSTDERSGRIAIPLKVATGAATFPSEAADGDSLLALARGRSA